MTTKSNTESNDEWTKGMLADLVRGATSKTDKHGTTGYTTDGFERLSGFFAVAQDMANADAEKVRDTGTCVVGAGIRVYRFRARARVATAAIVVRVGLQGNVSIQSACKRALAYLKSHGIDAFYDDGNMD